MANTAEELARRYEITREECDRFGYRSHVNAKKARDAGHFDEEIEPVTVEQGGSLPPITVKYDTHILENPSMEGDGETASGFRGGRRDHGRKRKRRGRLRARPWFSVWRAMRSAMV